VNRKQSARKEPPAGETAPSPFTLHRSLAGLSPTLLTQLARLGIQGELDLVLHLPLRYDDETTLYPINTAPPGAPVLVEGTVVDAAVQYRPRRQLVCHVEDGTGVLNLRFINFYPSQLKQLAPGTRVRAFGEIRDGFLGPEMIHPRYRIVRGDMPLPRSLTPVYPTTAGLNQDELRRAITRALERTELDDTLPPALTRKLDLPSFADAVRLLHAPPPQVPQADLQERHHPAWRRIKFDELLAQQLSMRVSH
jgi:ATP-dependent DNA helicase RecG